MKNLFAIIAFLISSGYLNAADKTESVEVIAHNKLTSFSPSIKAAVSQKELVNKNTGKITVSRRTHSVKKQRDILSQKNSKTTKKLRSESPVFSNKAFGFSFYSATSYLDVDLDGDGYYSEFGLDFDADIDTAEFKDVYAVVYSSENGGPWTEFFVTENYTIFSDDISDEYSVTFTLSADFPANQYDFLIDLFEVGFSDIVATIGPQEEDSLFALPLEDEMGDTLISYVASELFADFDADGFYTDLTLEYDVETQYTGETVYAEILVINRNEGWQQVLSSDDFILGNQTEFIDLTFNEGYPAGFYDIQINLIDILTGQVIAEAAQEFSSLRALPIESVNNDAIFDGPGSDVDVVVHGSSGSLSWSIFLLGLFGLARRK